MKEKKCRYCSGFFSLKGLVHHEAACVNRTPGERKASAVARLRERRLRVGRLLIKGPTKKQSAKRKLPDSSSKKAVSSTMTTSTSGTTAGKFMGGTVPKQKKSLEVQVAELQISLGHVRDTLMLAIKLISNLGV